MATSNSAAPGGQPRGDSTQQSGTGFQKMYFDVVEDTPVDLSKTEIAKNLAGMVLQAAGMIGGVQISANFSAFDKKKDPPAPYPMSALYDRAAKKQLEIHLNQYENAGYLEKLESSSDGKNTTWTTTSKFRGLDVLLVVYKDIALYVKNEGITDEDLVKIGCSAKMIIHREIDKAHCQDPITSLWRCCRGTGIDNITTTDVAGQFDELPF